MIEDFDIPKRGETCPICGGPFHGGTSHLLLKESGNEYESGEVVWACSICLQKALAEEEKRQLRGTQSENYSHDR